MRLSGMCVVALALSHCPDAFGPDLGRAFAQAVAAPQGAVPRFRADGPNADEFGRKEGYPSCKELPMFTKRAAAWVRSAATTPGSCAHHPCPEAADPLARAAGEPVVRYGFAGLDLTLDDYLDRHPVTGLLIAKGSTILAERYQYG